MPNDMLVKLYNLPNEIPNIEKLKEAGIEIKRALPVDKHIIVSYVKNTFSEGWASECDVSLSNMPVTCFVAVKDKNIIGFACYNATCLDFFGPAGVTEGFRNKGIGKVLLFKCLLSMREEGYAYAIIGWVEDAIEFYKKTVNAIVIEDSFPGVYQRMINS
jgi:GNAT superfamily N-acetyltransferase